MVDFRYSASAYPLSSSAYPNGATTWYESMTPEMKEKYDAMNPGIKHCPFCGIGNYLMERKDTRCVSCGGDIYAEVQ